MMYHISGDDVHGRRVRWRTKSQDEALRLYDRLDRGLVRRLAHDGFTTVATTHGPDGHTVQLDGDEDTNHDIGHNLS